MRIGIDLGGTKIEIIALADQSDTVLLRHRVHSPRGDYQATLDVIANLVFATEQHIGQTGSVGIGIPGTISPKTGLVKNANSTCLIGHPLDKDLAAILGRPVWVANDADCFALSEATDGAGCGYPVVFGVILGTGTGAGLVIDGRLIRGPNAITGEWGHCPLPWPTDHERPGPRCYCGKTGCIETFLSGPGMLSHAVDHGSAHRAAGHDIGFDFSSPEQIANAADNGDPLAVKIMDEYEDRLARSLAMIINILDPHAIILGGGLGNMKRLYKTIPQIWGRYTFSDSISTALLSPKFGDSSGVRGAAWLPSRPNPLVS